MTLSEFPEETCDHTEDWFDEYDDIYEMEPPVIRLIRICDDCGEREEYVLDPDPASDFQRVFDEYERKEMAGDIAHVGLRLDREKSTGINAFAHIIIERGEGTGEEVVGNGPYYFYY
jgi:hypothetical protein